MAEPKSMQPEPRDIQAVNSDASKASNALSAEVFQNPKESLRILKNDALPAAGSNSGITKNQKIDLTPTANRDTIQPSPYAALGDIANSFSDDRDERLTRRELRKEATSSSAAKFLLDNYNFVVSLHDDGYLFNFSNEPEPYPGISKQDVLAAAHLVDPNATDDSSRAGRAQHHARYVNGFDSVMSSAEDLLGMRYIRSFPGHKMSRDLQRGFATPLIGRYFDAPGLSRREQDFCDDFDQLTRDFDRSK